ncbi:ubinuclein-1 isoform X2 [Mercurialis annua]|uniref:ubinuclein-1 isoform X2 n=1 Tax=Mercurialis annua TaxID=3986 RepID=UPI00215E5EB9|nr:ubinuclein-1 isoform X2 [Mercurialis annua]
MEEGTSSGGQSSSARVMPSYVKLGDRQIFTVELRPGETTFVSWKKLMKDANKVNNEPVPSPDPPPVTAHPNLESRLAAGQADAENEAKEPPAPNRFNAVIEKIERLYMGKDSSDDEDDLKDVPDDDQYDTEDSFIDDCDLDEYFEVDNSAIKHSGFFVNRGKLERINEHTAIPNQQAKKRRKKDLNKAPAESDDGRISNKHVKVGKLGAGKTEQLPGKDSLSPLQLLAVTSEHYEDVKPQNLSHASGISSKKKSAETKMILDPSSSVKVSNGDASISLADTTDVEKPKTGGLQAKNLTNKSKDASGSLDASLQKYHDKSTYSQSKLQSAKSIANNVEHESSLRSKEKNGVHELPDLNIPDGKISMQIIKTSHVHKKDSSSVRSKGSVLENAIKELEKMVAESRPPALDSQDADTSSQAIKRRLPREVKLKLAKVARLAASQGKLSKELINRLMSILGHLMQLRTLKRNLKVMISMSLSAKQEKDDRFQQIKREVAEMIKTHGPYLESKALEQVGASDDFQEIGPQEKGAVKRKFSMDTLLEDKVCDLYDLFIDGLDGDAGPAARKLYIELAGLWPSGFMDNHGIKRAICRAKERRRASYNKTKEKVKRTKMLASRLDDSARPEAGSVASKQPTGDRLPIDTSGPILGLTSKPVTDSATGAVRGPSPSRKSSDADPIKQEKSKVSLSNPMEEAKMGLEGGVAKKKAKRKPEVELDETHIRPEKVQTQSSGERHEVRKQMRGLPQKLNLQLTIPSSEQS